MIKTVFSASLSCVLLCSLLLGCAPLTLPEDLSQSEGGQVQIEVKEEKESALEVYFRLKRLREQEQAMLVPLLRFTRFWSKGMI